MKPALILSAACLALAACSTMPTATVEPAPEFLTRPLPTMTYETPLVAAASLVVRYPETMEAGPTMNIAMAPLADDPSRLEMFVTAEPYLDDSVRGQQWRMVLAQVEGGSWRVEELGLRQKCYRSGNPDEWRAALCP